MVVRAIALASFDVQYHVLAITAAFEAPNARGAFADLPAIFGADLAFQILRLVLGH